MATRPLGLGRRERGVGAALFLLLGLLALRAPGFFAVANLRDLVVGNAPVLVASVGVPRSVSACHCSSDTGKHRRRALALMPQARVAFRQTSSPMRLVKP